MKTLLILALSVCAFGQGHVEKAARKGGGSGHNGGGTGGSTGGTTVSCNNGVWCLWQMQSASSSPLPLSFTYPGDPQPPCYTDLACNAASALTTVHPSVFNESQTLTMTFRVVANDAVFGFQTQSFNTCVGTPANFSLFLRHTNDDLSNPYYRWWAELEHVILNDGTYDTGVITVSVPLEPQYWNDVNGENGASSSSTQAGFANTLANISEYGITFGGGCFAGHGNYVESGSAVFTLESYSVN